MHPQPQRRNEQERAAAERRRWRLFWLGDPARVIAEIARSRWPARSRRAALSDQTRWDADDS